MAQETDAADEAESENNDWEPLNTTFTEAKEAAHAEWDSTTITERINVLVPYESKSALVEAAEETYDDMPSEYGDAPSHVLQQRVAEQKAEALFLDRHEVKWESNLEAFAKPANMTRTRRVDGETKHFRVWKVLLNL